MGTLVLLRGMLRSQHHEAECELIAHQQSADLSTQYSDCIIVQASADLPDGQYLVEFDGHSMRAVKEHDIWLTASPIERESAEVIAASVQIRIAELSLSDSSTEATPS
jgi:hypothetical protein